MRYSSIDDDFTLFQAGCSKSQLAVKAPVVSSRKLLRWRVSFSKRVLQTVGSTNVVGSDAMGEQESHAAARARCSNGRPRKQTEVELQFARRTRELKRTA